MYSNILTQTSSSNLFQYVHHHHILSAPTPSACLLFAVFGFNTGATKVTTAILAAISLSNLLP
jgi:hypothetical protein